jgi:hypothetical protein
LPSEPPLLFRATSLIAISRNNSRPLIAYSYTYVSAKITFVAQFWGRSHSTSCVVFVIKRLCVFLGKIDFFL